MTDKEYVRLAEERYSVDDFGGAAELCEEILSRSPRQAHAHYLLGLIAFRQRDFPQARDHLTTAAGISPKQSEYSHASGLACLELGDYASAAGHIQHAIRLSSRPGYHNDLGKVRCRQGNDADAILSFKHAIKQNARFLEAYCNLANCYLQQGHSAEAHAMLCRAVEANPTSVAARIALSDMLRSSNQIDEAIQVLENACQLLPKDPEAALALGDACQHAGRFSEAVASYTHAVRLDRGLTRPWYAMGCAQLSRREYAEAIKCFQEALALSPDWLEAEHNLARAFFEIGQSDEALFHFRRCADSGREDVAALANAMIALIIPGVPGADNAAILAARSQWAASDLARVQPFVSRRLAGPIRIGYISSFFHRPNWMKPVWGLINEHDRSEFELHLFSIVPEREIKSGYRRDENDHVHDISGMNNQELAAFIRGLDIDILVDLNSYSDMKRLPLLALRPARVIIAWFNLYATSAIDAVDYLIGDEHVIPVSEERFYSEKIRRISGSYLTFAVNYPVPDVSAPPCLARGAITFGSFCSLIKITPMVVEAWCEILKRSPGSLLLLKNAGFGSAANRDYMHEIFRRHGVPAERVPTQGPSEHFEFLKAYGEIDVALDTFPYNGGTTTTESIWQGVPVISFWGDRWVSRTSASLLRSGGLDEFVRSDVKDYVSFATELARNRSTPERLANLRRGMRDSLRSAAVCDTRSLARQIEAIYREAYVR